MSEFTAHSGEDGLVRLRAVMDTLRSPGGCPWDAEQTHESLIQYLIEETYEVIDAIEHGTRDDLLEELGDLLLQVFFHARIAEERDSDSFSVDDVAHAISNKLVRRHPHVFPDADGKIETVDSSVDVEARWQQLKNSEKARSSVLDGVPASLPPLTHASKILQRLKNAGMNPPVSANGMEVVENAVAHGISPTELMIAAIHHLRIADTDPETAMRQQVAALRKAITDIELSREG